MARASFTHYITDDSALGGMEIERSLRFDDGNDAHLSKTFSSAGNRKVWTWSAWIRRSAGYGVSNCMFHAYDGSSSNRAQIAFDTGDRLIVHQGGGGGSKGQTRTDRRFRDSNWYHIVCVANFSDSTAADRVKMYVNGELQTKTIQVAFTDENGLINSNLEHEIAAIGSSSNNFDGYMAEINFVDGQNLNPSFFGYTDLQTGKWRPKRFIPTGPNNGTVWSSTTNMNTNVFNGNVSNNFLAQVSNGYYTATTAPFTIKESLGVITDNGYHWGAQLNGSTEVTTGNLSNSMGVSGQTIVNFDLSSVTLPLDVTNLQIKAGTGSSGSTYIYGIVVDGVILIDGDVSNIGKNGFHLEFKDNSAATTTTIGKDTSGNSNNFAPDNMAVSNDWQHSDSFIDTPTNTFPIMSINTIYRVHNSSSNLHNGGLKYNCHYDNQGSVRAALTIPTSGKWYWEVRLLTSNSNATFGICPSNYSMTENPLSSSVTYPGAICYAAYGQYFRNGTNTSGVAGWGTSDTVALALDMDEKKITFYKNNSAQITLDLLSGYENIPYFPMLTGGTNAGSVNLGINFGANENWTYTPPSGFKSLCTRNLPTTSPSVYNPKKHFDTVTYTGDNTEYRKIPLDFKADLLWFKRRDASGAHVLSDTVTGITKHLTPNENLAQTTPGYPYVSSVQDNGIILRGSASSGGNVSGRSMVVWCWKAGGAAVTNNEGTASGSVSANPEAGFSIVSYTGSGGHVTRGHGLGKKPELIIMKKTGETGHWFINLDDSVIPDAGYDRNYVRLNTTGGVEGPNGNIAPSTAPDGSAPATDTIYSLGGDMNESGKPYVNYLWTSIPGYSKVGAFRGNGAAPNGSYVHTGFKVGWLLLRKVSGTADGYVLDQKRSPINEVLISVKPNSDAAETSDSNFVDFLSNGFKMKTTGGAVNSGTIVYLAIADTSGNTPFDTETNAR